ncbi:MAG: lysylphosphatidylglycerol synthase domain-containing protein [Hyphomonadaceae bacterium]|nr:lysylphosphatidylglycerol synthase domain-containing protein [Hyphomonadaceae bacterium]
MRQRLIIAARIVVALLFAALAIHVLVGEFGSLSLDDLALSLGEISWGAAGLMALATVAAFCAVVPYDAFALAYEGKRLSLRRSALSSTTSYAVSNLLGFPVLTGNAVRWWLFEHWGLHVGDVAIAALATTIVCNIAFAFIVGIALVVAPDLTAQVTGLSAEASLTAGLVMLAVAAALVLLAVVGPKGVKLWQFNVRRPGRLMLLQVLVCAVDYSATAAVLYIPLGPALGMDFLPFLALFSTAKTIGIFSNVPGGLGVFEAIIASTMGSISPADLAAALVAYRAIFYFAPFAIAATALAVHGLHRAGMRRTTPREPSTPST